MGIAVVKLFSETCSKETNINVQWRSRFRTPTSVGNIFTRSKIN